MSEHITHVTDGSFDADVLQSPTPVLVDFWAEWCGPCRMIAPVLEALAPEYDGRLKIVKLNIDDNEQTTARFGVRGIPTLMIFKGGEVAATKVGALSKAQLAEFVESSI
ncbi:MAG: thioredoxin TrxA [Oceanococcaceae bacterium]